MIRFALLFPLAFTTQVAFAQTNVPTGLDAERNLAELGNTSNATMVRTYDNRYEGVKGTPYFIADWSKATLTNNKTLYKNVDVKYNVYENKILYRSADGKEFILEPIKVDSFVLTDKNSGQEYNFRQVPALAAQEPKLANQFVVVLYEGKQSQLIMVPEKTLVKADFKGAYSSGKAYDELVDSHNFYFAGPDKKLTKIKLNKKNLLKALPDNQNKVQEYISSANLDMTTGAGWAKALAFYDSL